MPPDSFPGGYSFDFDNERESMNVPGWRKYRGYAHFDLPMDRFSADRWLATTSNVARHAFFPLLRFEQVTRRRAGPKRRVIQYAAHRDAAIYAWYAHLLGQAYESALAEHALGAAVLAYRPERQGTSIEFAKEVFDEIRRRKDCSVLCLDITGFFDNLDHDVLRRAWCRLIGVDRLPEDHFAVFNSVTRYSYVCRETLRLALGIGKRIYSPPKKPWNAQRLPVRREPKQLCTMNQLRELHNVSRAVYGIPIIERHCADRGIPQGTPVSAFLSNLYMLEFDKAASAFARSNGGFYRRYCDDILFVMPPGQAGAANAFATQHIQDLGLTLNAEKTETTHFASGLVQAGSAQLQYLGLTFDGDRIRIRDSSLARFRVRQMRAVNAATKAAQRRKSGRLYLRPLFRRYSHLGQRNFISYAARVSEITGDDAARRQVSGSIKRLVDDVARTYRGSP